MNGREVYRWMSAEEFSRIRIWGDEGHGLLHHCPAFAAVVCVAVLCGVVVLLILASWACGSRRLLALAWLAVVFAGSGFGTFHVLSRHPAECRVIGRSIVEAFAWATPAVVVFLIFYLTRASVRVLFEGDR